MIHSRPKILSVDDDELVLELIAEQLRERFDVTSARSGAEALDLLRGGEYAVLLADQRMPEMTGVQLASRARALNPHLVSVLLSGYTDPESMIAAINEGQVFRFVSKPWDQNELILTLLQAAERYALRRDNEGLLRELERRLRAMEVLQQVVSTAAAGHGAHPALVLLERLAEIVPFDLAGVLLRGDGLSGELLVLHAPAPVSEQNVMALKDQLFDMYAYIDGARLSEEAVAVRAALLTGARHRPMGAQTEVPLRVGDDTVGILVLQRHADTAYSAETRRELDLLANGTADALARMREGMQHELRRLEAVFTHAPDGVALCDASGKVIVANAAARSIFAQGGALEHLDWSGLGLSLPQVVAGRDVTDHRLDLGERTLALHVASLNGGTSVLVTARDVTRIEQQQRDRRAHFSALSHELRTPLTSLVAVADLLEAQMVGPLNAQQQHYVGVVVKCCTDLQRMVDDILDLERFGETGFDLRLEDTDMVELVGDVAERYGAAMREAGLTLRRHVPQGSCRAAVDAGRVRQILGNLLGNAVKFARAGSVVRVTLEATDALGGWVIMGVHNENEGGPISRVDLERIFQRFAQSARPKATRRRGTGLGLPISRAIARSHGGSLVGESGDEGTSFWAILPRAAGPSAAPERQDCALVYVEGPRVAATLAAVGSVGRGGARARLLPRERPGSDRGEPGSFVLRAEALGSRLQPVADAVGGLALHGRQSVALEGDDAGNVASALVCLGVPVVRPPERDAADVCVDVAGVDVEEGLVRVHRALSQGRSLEQTLAGLLRRGLRHSDDVLLIGKIENLEAYLTTYGSARRYTLIEELVRAARSLPAAGELAIAALPLDASVALVGAQTLRSGIEATLQGAFRAALLLTLRKVDRDRGHLELLGRPAGLPTLRVRAFTGADVAQAAAYVAAGEGD